MSSGLSIGQLGTATGTAVETIRYYEKIGLLAPPARTSGNYRNYGSRDVARLSFIRGARALGFGLDQVRSLLDLSDDHERPCDEVDAMARGQLKQVDQKIADLQSLRQELSGLISQCQRGTIDQCRILEALGPKP